MLCDNEIAFIEMYQFCQDSLLACDCLQAKDELAKMLEKHREIYEEFLHWKNYQIKISKNEFRHSSRPNFFL